MRYLIRKSVRVSYVHTPFVPASTVSIIFSLSNFSRKRAHWGHGRIWCVGGLSTSRDPAKQFGQASSMWYNGVPHDPQLMLILPSPRRRRGSIYIQPASINRGRCPRSVCLFHPSRYLRHGLRGAAWMRSRQRILVLQADSRYSPAAASAPRRRRRGRRERRRSPCEPRQPPCRDQFLCSGVTYVPLLLGKIGDQDVGIASVPVAGEFEQPVPSHSAAA